MMRRKGRRQTPCSPAVVGERRERLGGPLQAGGDSDARPPHERRCRLMARRLLDSRIVSSQQVCGLSDKARWLYVVSILSADDAGRMTEFRLLGDAYRTDAKVGSSGYNYTRLWHQALEQVVASNLLHRYRAADGRTLLHHPNWLRFQRLHLPLATDLDACPDCPDPNDKTPETAPGMMGGMRGGYRGGCKGDGTIETRGDNDLRRSAAREGKLREEKPLTLASTRAGSRSRRGEPEPVSAVLARLSRE